MRNPSLVRVRTSRRRLELSRLQHNTPSFCSTSTARENSNPDVARTSLKLGRSRWRHGSRESSVQFLAVCDPSRCSPLASGSGGSGVGARGRRSAGGEEGRRGPPEGSPRRSGTVVPAQRVRSPAGGPQASSGGEARGSRPWREAAAKARRGSSDKRSSARAGLPWAGTETSSLMLLAKRSQRR